MRILDFEFSSLDTFLKDGSKAGFSMTRFGKTYLFSKTDFTSQDYFIHLVQQLSFQSVLMGQLQEFIFEGTLGEGGQSCVY